MSFSALLRLGGVVWIVPVLFALQSLVLFGTPMERGYVQSSYAQLASAALYPAGPLVAGCAAAHLHRFREFHAQAPRVRVGVPVRAFGPLVLCSALCVVMALLLRVGRLPDDGRSVLVVAAVGSAMVACGVWGLAVGWALPVFAAVPVAMAVPFIWIAYLPATTSPLAHRLTPDIPCCDIGRQVSGTFLAGLLVLAGVSAVLLVAALSLRSWSLVPRALASVWVVLSVAVAVGLAALVTSTEGPLTAEVDEQRSTRQVCEEGDGLRVCLWPEQRRLLPEVREVVAQVNAAVAGGGLPTVSAAVADVAVAGRDGGGAEGSLVIPQSGGLVSGRSSMELLVAAGYVGRLAGCTSGLSGDRAADILVASLVLRGGGTVDAGSVLDPVVDEARQAAALSPDEFAALVRERAVTARCGR